MKKYNSFVKYLNRHYKEVIKEELLSFLIEQYETKVCIKSLTIKKVIYTKSEIDKVEFDCFFNASYILLKNEKEELNLQINSFICYFKGSFSEGFKLSNKDIEIYDEEEFNERYTKELIPVIKKNEIDKYATKFLKYFCAEALQKPTKLNLRKMLNDKGIYCHKAPLEENVYGKIYFAEDIAKIYDSKHNIIETKVNKGTILINDDIKIKRKEISFRNTIIHEAIHWYFHRNYFEQRQLLDNNFTYAVFYKGGQEKNNQIALMERQARALAPRILMPKKQFLIKFNEISEELDKATNLSLIKKWHKIIVKLSKFFGVSYQSVKYRLRDLNKHRADGVFNFIDGKYIKEFTFKENYLKEYQTFVLDRKSFIRLLKANKKLFNLFIENKIDFINNMVVINNSKYVNENKKRLTDYALNNVHKCCLVFEVFSEYDKLTKTNNKQYFLFSQSNNLKTKAIVNKESLTMILKKIKNDATKQVSQKTNLKNDFTKDLNYYYNKSNYTQEQFAEESDINIKYIRAYLKGTKDPSQIEVIRMAIALNLSYSSLSDLLTSKNMMILPLGEQNQGLLICLLLYKDKLVMDEIYLALKEAEFGNLLNLSENYLKNHNLI